MSVMEWTKGDRQLTPSLLFHTVFQRFGRKLFDQVVPNRLGIAVCSQCCPSSRLIDLTPLKMSKKHKERGNPYHHQRHHYHRHHRIIIITAIIFFLASSLLPSCKRWMLILRWEWYKKNPMHVFVYYVSLIINYLYPCIQMSTIASHHLPTLLIQLAIITFFIFGIILFAVL